jgi:hypothetical protein
MALGNRFDHAPFDGVVSALGGCPVTDETSRSLRWFTGQGHDLTPLLGTKGGQSQDDLGSETQMFKRLMGMDQRRQRLALSFAKGNPGRG